MIPALLDRTFKLLPTLYTYLKRAETEHPAIRKIIKLLENPPENLYITSYPKTPIRGERTDERFAIRGVTLGVTIDYKIPPRIIVVMFPVLQEAPDKILLYILAHELTHASGYREEYTPETVTGILHNRFPDVFASDEEVHEYTGKWIDKAFREDIILYPSFHRVMRTKSGVDRLMSYARKIMPIKIPVKPPFNPREYAVEIAVKEGLSKEDAEKLIDELWPDIEVAIKDKGVEEAKKIIETMVRPEARRRAVPPPKPPPKPPAPPKPPTIATIEELLEKISSEERSQILTFGVPKFITEYGGRYGLTIPETPLIEKAFTIWMRERMREYRVDTGPKWFAVTYLPRMLPRILHEGMSSALKYFWSEILSQLRRYLEQYRLPSYEEIHIRILSPETSKVYEYGFGRAWIEDIAYHIYEIAGVSDEEVPGDYKFGKRIIDLWRSEGYPSEKMIMR